MGFGRFFVVRLTWAVVAFWLAVTVAFFASLPAPAREPVYCGSERLARCVRPPSEDYDADHTFAQRYRHFISSLAQERSPGSSLISGQDTGAVARAAMAVTASLVGLALLLAIGAAVPLALAREWPARLLGLLLGSAYAAFLLGFWALRLFGVGLGWAPVGGYCGLLDPHADCGGVGDWFSHLLLPATVLAVFPAAIYARVIRSSLLRVRASKEKDHGVRRIVLPFARVVARDFGFLVGAAVFVEAIFGLPGLGDMLTSAIDAKDRLAVEAALVYASALAIGVHLAVDLVVGALDRDLRRSWPVAAMPVPA